MPDAAATPPAPGGLKRSMTRQMTVSLNSAKTAVRKLSMESVQRFFSMPARVMESPQKKAKAGKKKPSKEEIEAESAFTEFDTEHNGLGTLTFREAKTAFEQLAAREGLKTRFTAEVTTAIFEHMDTNSDHTIDLGEWKTAYGRWKTWLTEEKLEQDTVEEQSRKAPPKLSKEDKAVSKEIAVHTGDDIKQTLTPSQLRLRELLKPKEARAWAMEEKDALSRLFLMASCGRMQGKYGSGGSDSSLSVAEMLEFNKTGSIDKAELAKAKFDVLCENGLGVATSKIKQALWRTARPGRDSHLTFQELCNALAAPIKGSFEQRCAFVYSIYDEDDSGELSKLELSRFALSIHAGCIFEADVLSFSREGTPEQRVLSFDDYADHCKKNGECDFVKRLQKIAANEPF